MLERAQKIQGQLVHWRRDLHMHPELGFQETRTSASVTIVQSEAQSLKRAKNGTLPTKQS